MKKEQNKRVSLIVPTKLLNKLNKIEQRTQKEIEMAAWISQNERILRCIDYYVEHHKPKRDWMKSEDQLI